MRWFRVNRRLGGRLALFALALQFFLAFGHIHPEDIFGPADAARSVPAAIALPAAEVLRPLAADSPWYHADELCPICASVYLLGTAFVPEAPRPLLPFTSPAIERFAHVAAVFAAPRRAPFQSRAPPLA